MMRVGTDFTYQGRRYSAGDRFELGSVPAYLQGTLVRLYKLTDAPKPKPLKKEEKHYGLHEG